MDAKKLLTNKWVWIAGGGVLGLGYLLLRGGSSSSDTSIAYDDSTPYGDVGSSSGGDSSGSSGGSSSGGDSSGSYVTSSQLIDTLGALSGAYASGLTSLQVDFQSQIMAMQLANSDMQHELINEINIAKGSGVIDTMSIDNGVSFMSLGDIDIPVGVSDPIMLTPDRYYGDGGVNYNTASASEKQAMLDRQKRLETDTSFLQTEIDRAKLAIKDRKSDGLDFSAQQKELDKLSKMVGANNSKKAG